jgi:hypothetical protein
MSETVSFPRAGRPEDGALMPDLKAASRARTVEYFGALSARPESLRQLLAEIELRREGTAGSISRQRVEAPTTAIGTRFNDVLATIDGGLIAFEADELPAYWRAEASPLTVPAEWLGQLGAYTVIEDSEFVMPDITREPDE